MTLSRLSQHIKTINRLANEVPDLIEWENNHDEVSTHHSNWPVIMASYPKVKSLYLLAMTEDWEVWAEFFFLQGGSCKHWPSQSVLNVILSAMDTRNLVGQMAGNLEKYINISHDEEWGPGVYNPPFCDLFTNVRDYHNQYKITLCIAEGSGNVTGSVVSGRYSIDLSEDKVILTYREN